MGEDLTDLTDPRTKFLNVMWRGSLTLAADAPNLLTASKLKKERRGSGL